MRNLIALLLLTAPILIAACQTSTSPSNTVTPVATQPGPMDNVTNPLKQPGFDSRGTMR